MEVKSQIVLDGGWSCQPRKRHSQPKRKPLSPCVQSCIENSVPLGNPHIQMASTQQLLDAKKATSDQRIRELTAQLDKEKAEAEAAVAAEAKAVVEAKVEHQRQEAIRKAKAEAAAKQAESDAIRRQEEANKKARAEIRKGKRKVEGPPAESSATRASTGGLCAQCVAAGKLCAPQGGRRATACK
jgi:membrane protein involved in colicin uptake